MTDNLVVYQAISIDNPADCVSHNEHAQRGSSNRPLTPPLCIIQAKRVKRYPLGDGFPNFSLINFFFSGIIVLSGKP